jgi:hypothetical protein
MRLRDLYDCRRAPGHGFETCVRKRRKFSTNSQARFLSGVGKSAAFLASLLTTTCS